VRNPGKNVLAENIWQMFLTRC